MNIANVRKIHHTQSLAKLWQLLSCYALFLRNVKKRLLITNDTKLRQATFPGTLQPPAAPA